MARMVKNLPAMQETWVRSLGQEDPWRRECLSTPVFLPGESSGLRSQAGYSPWGHKESDITEQLTLAAAAAAKLLQSCPTRCDPIDGSPPGSPVPGILQARTLEWVAISFSNA